MDLKHVLFEREDRVATVTLNRPEVLNALNAKIMEELECVFYEVSRDPDISVCIITGAGGRAFAAGADIAELVKNDPRSGSEMAARGQRTLRLLETMGKPSIAAVNGYALGGGCELAMACTIRIASEKAKFAQPEVGLGIIPGYAGTQRLPRLVGKGVALDLILTGRTIDANEALRIGLVSRVVPHENLRAAAEETAGRLLEKGPLALKAATEAIDRGFDLDFDDACRFESSLFGLLCATEDMREGLSAFLEKRKPHFKGK